MLLAEYRSLGGMRRGTPLIYRKKMVVTRNFEFILIQLFTLSTIQVYIGSYLIRLKSSRHQWALRYEQEPRKTRGYGPTRDPCAGMCHHASWAPHCTLGLATCLHPSPLKQPQHPYDGGSGSSTRRKSFCLAFGLCDPILVKHCYNIIVSNLAVSFQSTHLIFLTNMAWHVQTLNTRNVH